MPQIYLYGGQHLSKITAFSQEILIKDVCVRRKSTIKSHLGYNLDLEYLNAFKVLCQKLLCQKRQIILLRLNEPENRTNWNMQNLVKIIQVQHWPRRHNETRGEFFSRGEFSPLPHQESLSSSRGEFFIHTPHQESLSWSRCEIFTKRASCGLVVNFLSLPPTKRASRGLVVNFSPRELLVVSW